jgi:membrane-bound ClpP family serine protease
MPTDDRSPLEIAESRYEMMILGVVLLIVGLVAKIAILETIGGILIVVGVVLFPLGSTGRAIGGRRHYY